MYFVLVPNYFAKFFSKNSTCPISLIRYYTLHIMGVEAVRSLKTPQFLTNLQGTVLSFRKSCFKQSEKYALE